MLFPFRLLLAATVLPSFSRAANSFSYNEDMQCAYPFTEFSISSINCMSKSYVFLEGEGNDKDEQRDENGGGECYFGDQAEMSGSVTNAEAVSRYFDVYLTVCFKGSYYLRNCLKYKTSLDMTDGSASEQQNDNNYEDQYEARASNQADFLSAGTHSYKARFSIPQKRFTFKTGSIVSVSMTLHPKKTFLGPTDYSYSYNSIPFNAKYAQCYATFDAIAEDGSEYTYGYRASALSAAAAVLAGFGYLCIKKRRVICQHCIDPEVDDDSDGVPNRKRQGVEPEMQQYFERMDDTGEAIEMRSKEKKPSRFKVATPFLKSFNRKNKEKTCSKAMEGDETVMSDSFAS